MKNQKILRYRVFGKRLIIASQEGIYKASFLYPIHKVEQFGDILVAMLNVPIDVTFNENIFGVSWDGKILWQIPVIKHLYDSCPYTGLYKENDCVGAFNM